MDDKNFSLLLCTNGDEHTCPALEYGVWLAGILKSEVLLLGIEETPEQRNDLEKLLAEISQKLEAAQIPHQVRRDRGRGSRIVAAHASKGNFLTVIGPLGRPTWRRIVQGRSFRRIMEQMGSPLLYVPEAHSKLEEVLICTGGLEYSARVEELAVYLAGATQARVTFLHVVEPVTLEYPVSLELQDNWQKILETDTPQGEHLRQALKNTQDTGLEARVKVRHGHIIHEILEEVHSGDYDLVGMGSMYSAHSLRHLYLPNVTAEVAEGLNRPVLTVR